MASIHEELEQFHRFAAQRIEQGGSHASLEELFVEWCDSQSREEINEAIRRSLADVDAGRYEPAEQAIREQFILPKQ